jgi:hypothetical protein
MASSLISMLGNNSRLVNVCAGCTGPRDIRGRDGLGGRSARFRPRLPSDRDLHLCLVIADRGQHEAPVLCGTAYNSDRLAARGGAGGDRRGTSEGLMYKSTSRFRQSLARKGYTLVGPEPASPRRRLPSTAALGRRLDKEVQRASQVSQQEPRPHLVKRPRETGPSN